MKKICVFAGASAGHKSSYADAAHDLGTMIASYGLGLVYGGGRSGLMGRVADGAIDGGGTVIGIIPKFLDRVEIGHAGVTKLHVIDTMHQRKELMYAESDAFIVLPGGLGTLDETMEITTWRQLDLHKNAIRVLPQGIGNLKSLAKLDLSENRLVELPVTICELNEALQLLASEQERATPAELMAAMTGYVDSRTAELFMRDSGALPQEK